jgi:acyl carrier protein
MANKIEWSDFSQNVAEYIGMESEEVTEETNLYSDLGLDSLGLFSLGMFLIKKYSVEIPLAAVATIETVNDIFTLMNEQLAANPA